MQNFGEDLQVRYKVVHADGHTHEVSNTSFDKLLDRIKEYNKKNPSDKKKLRVTQTKTYSCISILNGSSILTLTRQEYNKLLSKQYIILSWYGSLLFIPYTDFIKHNIPDSNEVFIIDPMWFIENEMNLDSQTEVIDYD